MNMKAIDKYLERMYVARTSKEETQKKEEKKVGSGNLWKNKLTVPKAPKLAERPKKKKEENSALKRPVTPKSLANRPKAVKRHEFYPATEQTQQLSKDSSTQRFLRKQNQGSKSKFLNGSGKENEGRSPQDMDIPEGVDLIQLNEKMDYDDAVKMIHDHILGLNI